MPQSSEASEAAGNIRCILDRQKNRRLLLIFLIVALALMISYVMLALAGVVVTS